MALPCAERKVRTAEHRVPFERRGFLFRGRQFRATVTMRVTPRETTKSSMGWCNNQAILPAATGDLHLNADVRYDLVIGEVIKFQAKINHCLKQNPAYGLHAQKNARSTDVAFFLSYPCFLTVLRAIMLKSMRRSLCNFGMNLYPY